MEAEAYLKKDERYYPALRLDTLALSFAVSKNSSTIIAGVMNALALKAASVDTGRIFKRNGYTATELETRYRERFDKPILRTEQLKAGVYTSFREFVNNNPSIIQYEFKKDRKSTTLYTKTLASDWLPERKAFGFCDGRRIWINVNNMFHPLVRSGNTFEFRGDYNLLNSRGGSVVVSTPSTWVSLGGTLLATAASNAVDNSPKQKVVYQVNMEKGGYY